MNADWELVEAAAQRAHDAEVRANEHARLATRMRQRAMWLAGVAVFAVLLAIVAGTVAVMSSPEAEKAEQRARVSLARQLAAQSLNEANVSYDLSWLLAIEAGRRAETAETFDALRRAFAHPGRTLAVLGGHTSRANQAAWNADESRILTASNDGAARVWDAASGAELTILTGHTGWVYQAVWSADGSRILTASDDGTAWVWDARSGTELLTLSGHTAWVNQAVWNGDESRILTGSGDRTARIWDAARAEPSLLNSPVMIRA